MMVLATFIECAKSMGLCLTMPAICLEYQLFHYHAWSYYQFFGYTLWQSYSILASSFALLLHLMLLHYTRSLVIASNTLHF